MAYKVIVTLSDEEGAYLKSCAKIRRTSRRYLIIKMLKLICREQMVLSVLDDDSKPIPREEWFAFVASEGETLCDTSQ